MTPTLSDTYPERLVCDTKVVLCDLLTILWCASAVCYFCGYSDIYVTGEDKQ